MTDNEPQRECAVYRLMPSRRDIRGVLFDEGLVQLKRWEIYGPPVVPPEWFGARWQGERSWPKAAFPSTFPDAPVLSSLLVERFGAEWESAGRLLPLTITDGGAVVDEDYRVWRVDEMVDCVDTAASSRPNAGGEMARTVFRADALPVRLPAFRVPQAPTCVYWNGWMVDRLKGLLGDDLEARLAWSNVPGRRPHRYVWGV
ncbi:hypothetical protein [Streptomyces sedi]|uniref:Uncharacterized protein n=1 Tax=Streptomyces sedi TaxID=555059 RepID=A0A5C4VD09_9ACTN|nr:hypothetical protein [Streptomyces sedi]TNM33425.1 hypothetical protein FH715_03430 [Streptomyces sedi]